MDVAVRVKFSVEGGGSINHKSHGYYNHLFKSVQEVVEMKLEVFCQGREHVNY